MNLDFIPDWVLDWKTGLFWGLGCFGLAFWLLLFGIYRDVAEIKKAIVNSVGQINSFKNERS